MLPVVAWSHTATLISVVVALVSAVILSIGSVLGAETVSLQGATSIVVSTVVTKPFSFVTGPLRESGYRFVESEWDAWSHQWPRGNISVFSSRTLGNATLEPLRR